MSSEASVCSDQLSTLASDSKINDQNAGSTTPIQESPTAEDASCNKFSKRDFVAPQEKRRSNLNFLPRGGDSLRFDSGVAFGAKAPRRQSGPPTQNDAELPSLTEYTVFWISSGGHVTEVKTMLEKTTAIECLMKKSLSAINEKALREDYDFQLLENLAMFELYFAKKTGLPKIDLPAIDPKQALFMTRDKTFTLKEISNEAVIKLDRRNHDNTSSTLAGKSHKTTKLTTMGSVLSDDSSRRISVTTPVTKHYENVLVSTKRKQSTSNNTNPPETQSPKKSFWSFMKICSYEKAKD